MEQYIVSARKYRPSTFDSVVGQQALTATLKNAIATGRLAHAYLFCGSRGVGKTSCARIFAKTINCTNRTKDGEACNECDSCRQFNENRSMNILELDAASNNGVEDIKSLMEQVQVPPTLGKYRVFIIDEVHMLTTAAFNAFLKTLEEPPAHAIFILATTEKHKIIPTILSRCQIYDFNRITIDDMVAHMQRVAEKEGYTAQPEALNVIAQKADGAMRDALSIFDQVAASSMGDITYQATIDSLNVLDNSYYERLLDAFVGGDVAKALLIYKEVREKGFDSQFFINGLGQYMRDLAVATNPATLQLVEATEEMRQKLAQRAATLHPTFIYRAMELCNDADFNFRQATNKQFLIELTLIRLCQPPSPSSSESGADEGHLKPLTPAVGYQAPAVSVQNAPQTEPAPAARQEVKLSPAVQPHAPKPASPPPFTGGSLSLGSISAALNRKPEVVKPEAPKEKLRHEYTDADVQGAWRTAVERAELGPMLTSILGANHPERIDGDRFAVRVSTEVEAGLVEKPIVAVNRYLCELVGNDFIELSIEICERELPKNMWTDDKVLEAIIEEHPAMKHFMEKYQLRRL